MSTAQEIILARGMKFDEEDDGKGQGATQTEEEQFIEKLHFDHSRGYSGNYARASRRPGREGRR